MSIVFEDESIILDSEKFPIIWLRDNCQCEKCFDVCTQARIIDWDNFNFNVQPIKVDIKNDSLNITWDYGHQSAYQLSWLKARSFSNENVTRFKETSYRQTKEMWSRNNFVNIFKSFDYMKVLNENETLLEWLNALAVYGIAVLKNTPPNEDEIYNLAKRVAFIRKTHYGNHFVVKAKPVISTVAYTPTTLQLHTDIPYFDNIPGVNLLHCIVQSQSEGGKNLLADGFYVAEKLRCEYPDYFTILSTVPTNWNAIGTEGGQSYHYMIRAPVICIDIDGKVSRINRSINNRDSFFSENVITVQKWYKAMAKFVELLRLEAAEYKMEASDFLTFDNTRCVHGRTAYKDTSNNARTLIGAYIDWDHIYSRLRVLKTQALHQ